MWQLCCPSELEQSFAHMAGDLRVCTCVCVELQCMCGLVRVAGKLRVCMVPTWSCSVCRVWYAWLESCV